MYPARKLDGVPEDASLDEFVDAGGGSDSTTDGTGDGEGGDPEDREPGGDDPVERGTVGGAGGDESAAQHGGDEEPSDEGGADGIGDAEPASSTAAWSDEPRDCADCGTGVRRRWRDGDALVCGDCKEW